MPGVSAYRNDHITAVLDVRGLKCPMPVIRTEQRLRRLARALRAGGSLLVIADDPLAAIDIPHFCRQSGYQIFRLDRVDGLISMPGDIIFTIQRPEDQKRR